MPSKSQSRKRDGGGDARFDRGVASFAIGGLAFSTVGAAIRRAWAASTSYDPEEWRYDNPAWGQCASTAIVLWRIYGGEVMRCYASLPGGAEILHYFNRFPDGTMVDMTRQQFPDGTEYTLETKRRPAGQGVSNRADRLLERILDQWWPYRTHQWGVRVRGAMESLDDRMRTV